jgi:hypothetical protein
MRWHRWLSLLLALEVTLFGRPAADRGGAARVDPADKRGEPSWGAPRIHGEGRSIKRRQVHGQTARAAKPGMADILAQSCSRNRRHGLHRCSNHRFRSALCLRHRPTGPQRSALDQRHKESDGRMGCPPTHGGVPLGRGSGRHDPRPGGDRRGFARESRSPRRSGLAFSVTRRPQDRKCGRSLCRRWPQPWAPRWSPSTRATGQGNECWTTRCSTRY